MKNKLSKPLTLQDFFPHAPAPLLFAHRGCSARYPENTLVAFKAALKNKIPAIELDVHLTKDGNAVLIHDYNCKRITGENHLVAKTSLVDLQKLNAAHVFNQSGSTNCKEKNFCPIPEKAIDTPIPTLESLFQLAGKNFYYDIEVKVKKHRKITLKKIADLVKKYQLESQILLSSFDPFIVRWAKAFPFQATALIYGEEEDRFSSFFSRILRFLKKAISQSSILKPRRDHAKQEAAKEFQRFQKGKQNRPIATWTVDKKEEALSLLAAKVEGLCSNHPEDLLS